MKSNINSDGGEGWPAKFVHKLALLEKVFYWSGVQQLARALSSVVEHSVTSFTDIRLGNWPFEITFSFFLQ